MKSQEFDIHKYCGKCKEPLSTHSKYGFGFDCPSHWVLFEDEEVWGIPGEIK